MLVILLGNSDHFVRVVLGTRSWRAALAAGHQVVATARNPQALDKLVERYPGRLLTLPLDVGVIVD
jgi:NADP-dependent 3-hydroxy acid dehydrogenase YdfG